MIEFFSFALPLMGRNFLHVLPLLLLTLPLAEWLKRSGLAERYVPALKARPLVSVLVATIVGAVSPLCSCGVIPVIAGFLRAGVPLGPIMAFWIASPSMDPEVFALSAGMLGLPLAIGRLLATGCLSLLAGLAAHYLELRGFFGAESLRGSARRLEATPLAVPQAKPSFGAPGPLLAYAPAAASGGCGCSAPAAQASLACCQPSGPSPVARAMAAAEPCACDAEKALRSLGSEARAIALASLKELPRLGGIMLLAFFLEALVIRFVPMEIVARLLGSGSRLGVPLATAIGVPLYATNLAALGLVRGLLGNGMSGGAALAFLIGGAATTVPAMAAVWSLVKPKLFAFYIGSIVAGALLAGYAWELFASIVGG